MDNVIFTTFTKRLTDTATTPTRERCEEFERCPECCIFYNVWHNPLDFTMVLV